MTKSILIHLGPHKTGSTAIQKTLSASTLHLQSARTLFYHNDETHRAALALANEEFDRAEILLSGISEKLTKATEKTVILSQEDFAGELAGRSKRRAIYPRLTKNMRILSRALRPHHVKFVFFVREEESWLKSCYHQHLKHRTRFSTFCDFKAHYAVDFTWEAKLQKPKETFGADLVIAQYGSEPDAGLKRLLSLIADEVGIASITTLIEKSNTSPTADKLALLEQINSISESKETAWHAKSLVLKNWEPKPLKANEIDYRVWPTAPTQNISSPLPALQKRARTRVTKQSVADILPRENCDLHRLLNMRLPLEATLPNAPRSDMKNQAEILKYHLRGKSELNYLNALSISYLRRDTPFTAKARTIFHRIWREHGAALINELSTRWLISTLQTFLDHGQNENQRQIGSSGYFYANMIKIYEGERAIERREQDATYEFSEPQTPNRFRGMDRYNVGGTDLLLNTNALLLEIADRDEIAGIVLRELLLRVKHSANVFTRHDKTRAKSAICVPGFEDTWAFFEPL